MNASTVVEVPRQVREQLRPVHPAVRDSSTAQLGATEEHRWLLLLLPPFVASSAFFAAAIGTGASWLMAPALVFGSMLIIFGFIYLGLSSDSNSTV